MSRILQEREEGKVCLFCFCFALFCFETNEHDLRKYYWILNHCFNRHTVILDLFVGWLLNQLENTNTANNQMFGHLELLVISLILSFQFHFEKIVSHLLMIVLLIIWYKEMINLNFLKQFYMIWFEVWEIVSQREPHTDVDPIDVGALIRCVFSLPFSTVFSFWI
jgi:hypothetical protein